MAKEFASLGIIEVDGLEIDLTKCDVRVITGRKPVKTINRKARVKGFAKGITTIYPFFNCCRATK
ncbi:hypothetical protein [Pasteurella multocida]|uniref:hypothetical protein n=1 Tax=Pasteurella multocida TaxID=747 RepID=UPI003969F440